MPLQPFCRRNTHRFCCCVVLQGLDPDLAQTGPVCYTLATSLLSPERTGPPLPSWVQGRAAPGNCEPKSLQKAWEGQVSPYPHSGQGIVSMRGGSAKALLKPRTGHVFIAGQSLSPSPQFQVQTEKSSRSADTVSR